MNENIASRKNLKQHLVSKSKFENLEMGLKRQEFAQIRQ